MPTPESRLPTPADHESDVRDTRAAPESFRVTLERELGRGATATVYLGHDAKHDRTVAVKVLDAELTAMVGGERFAQEVRLMARLQHPHILGLLDSGVFGADAEPTLRGRPYYVMPRVEGESLRAWLQREAPLSITDALRIAGEVASALDYAHRHGVIHRDIKPENILLQDGHALVADFGIALALEQAGGEERLTATGLSLGTVQYMSPEQAMGEKTIDGRTDIYALATVLYEMLTGEPPFVGATAQAVIARRLSAPAPSVRMFRDTIPEHVDRAIACAMARMPADRFPTAAAFALALEGKGASGEQAMRAWPSGRLRRVAGAALVSIAAVAVAAVALAHRDRGPSSASSVARRGTSDSLAYALYVRARDQANRRSALNVVRSLQLYRQSIARDSNFADAWAGFSRALFFARNWGYPVGDAGVSPDSVVPLLVRASERAIELDSASALAWLARADALRFTEPAAIRGALQAVRRSLAIDSTSADAWFQLGTVWQDSLELRLAIDAYRRAVARQPRYVNALAFLGFCYMWLSQNDSALVWADSAVAVDPSAIFGWHARSVVRQARHEWDLAEPDYETVVRLGTGADRVYGWAGLAELAHRRNDRRAVDTLVAHAIATADTIHPTRHDAAYLAWAYAGTGQRERAIHILERYQPRYDAHFQLHLQYDPPLQGLRSDPRYLALLRRR